MLVSDSAHALLERVVIEHAGRAGLSATAAGVIEAHDVVVRGTVEDAIARVLGTAAMSTESGAVVLERAWLHENRASAIFAREGTRIDARDLVISASADAPSGRGVTAERGATATLERALVSRARGVGLFATLGGATLRATDVVVRDSRPTEEIGWDGVGVWAQADCTIELTRARIERTFMTAIGAQARANVSLDGVVVSGVVASACAETTCPEIAGGFGLVAVGASVTATDFVIEDLATCGVVVAALGDELSEMDLVGGRISRAPVGACVQQEGFDVARLRAGVAYEDVGVPLQATSYSLPDAL